MDLREAKQFLNEKGYELLYEGKFGRALAAGALALTSLFNTVHARDLIDFRHADNEKVKEWCINHPSVKCDYKNDHLLFKHTSTDYTNPENAFSLTYIPLKNNTIFNKIKGIDIADIYIMNVPKHNMLSLNITLYDYTELVFSKIMDEYTFEVKDTKTDKTIKKENIDENYFYNIVNSYYEKIIK